MEMVNINTEPPRLCIVVNRRDRLCATCRFYDPYYRRVDIRPGGSFSLQQTDVGYCRKQECRSAPLLQGCREYEQQEVIR